MGFFYAFKKNTKWWEDLFHKRVRKYCSQKKMQFIKIMFDNSFVKAL